MRKTSLGFTVAHRDRDHISRSSEQVVPSHPWSGGRGRWTLCSTCFFYCSGSQHRQWCHPQRMYLPTSINPQIIVNRRAQRPDSQVILDLDNGLSITSFVLYSSVHYSPVHSKCYQSFLVVTHRTKGKMFQKWGWFFRDPECAVGAKGSKGKSILLIHALEAQAYNPNSSGDSYIPGHLEELRSSFKTKKKLKRGAGIKFMGRVLT